MKKDFNHGDDLYKALLVYQNTPLENGFSAAQLLMGRRSRSNLPINANLLKFRNNETIQKKKEIRKWKQKYYFDKRAHDLPSLNPGDRMCLRTQLSNIWAKGVPLENS